MLSSFGKFAQTILGTTMLDMHAKRQQAIITAQKTQRWALLVVAVVGVLVAKLAHFAIGKGIVWGAMVAFLMQWAFTKLSFLHTRPHPKQMMNDMYMAMLARWGVGIVGFLLAFAWLKLSGLGVIVGFLAMQGAIFVSLYKIR